MLALVVEAAVRSFVLGSAVWLGLRLLRAGNPRVHMTAWTVVLVASLAMPLGMHQITLTLPSPAPAPPLPAIVAAPEAGVADDVVSQAPAVAPILAPEPFAVSPLGGELEQDLRIGLPVGDHGNRRVVADHLRKLGEASELPPGERAEPEHCAIDGGQQQHIAVTAADM